MNFIDISTADGATSYNCM